MRTERLVVLLSPREKARIAALAQERRTSIGEFVRSMLAAVDERSVDRTDGPHLRRQGGHGDEPVSVEQAAALERLAEVAVQSMRRANAALDRAFEEIETTQAYLAKTKRKRTAPA